LHTTPFTWREKVEAVVNSGCTRMDGALKGFGGCPMAKDELTGNMPTENVIAYLNEKGIQNSINLSELENSLRLAAITLG
jgi:hydroxymethylglutaryl-CoA lyase